MPFITTTDYPKHRTTSKLHPVIMLPDWWLKRRAQSTLNVNKDEKSPVSLAVLSVRPCRCENWISIVKLENHLAISAKLNHALACCYQSKFVYSFTKELMPDDFVALAIPVKHRKPHCLSRMEWITNLQHHY